MELRLLFGDDSKVLHTIKFPLLDADGEIVGVGGITSDFDEGARNWEVNVTTIDGEGGTITFAPGIGTTTLTMDPIADSLVDVLGQWRIAVPMLHFIQPEPTRLHRIIAMRQARKRSAHRIDQCINHLTFHPIGQMT